jgi:hypothetical protein
MQKHGKDYDKLMAALPSKTLSQIKNYIQNYAKKVNPPFMLNSSACGFAGNTTARHNIGSLGERMARA